MKPQTKITGEGPHKSLCTSSNGALETVVEEEKGRFEHLPYLQGSQKEKVVVEPMSGNCDEDRIFLKIETEGWPRR